MLRMYSRAVSERKVREMVRQRSIVSVQPDTIHISRGIVNKITELRKAGIAPN